MQVESSSAANPDWLGAALLLAQRLTPVPAALGAIWPEAQDFESKKELHMKLLERRRDELAAAALDSFLHGAGTPEQRLPAMIDAWFAHVEEHPDTSRILLKDATGDPDIQALQRELRGRQRAADVALLRELAPQLPEPELEPLGEIIRSSLTGLALWWLEKPSVPRAVPVAAVLRVATGVLRTTRPLR